MRQFVMGEVLHIKYESGEHGRGFLPTEDAVE